MPSYIYLVECENGEKKIGRTTQKVCTYFLDRLRAYGICTIIAILRVSTHYVVQIETDIIAEFKTTFKLAYGREFFYGDAKKMEEIINSHIAKYRHIEDPEVQIHVVDAPLSLPSLPVVPATKEKSHMCEGCGNTYASKQAKCAHKSKNPACKQVKNTDIQGQFVALMRELNVVKARLKLVEKVTMI